MSIDLSDEAGKWFIKGGQVHLLMEVIQEPDGTMITNMGHIFPATDQGFRTVLDGLQTEIALSVYGGREQEAPDDALCTYLANHYRTQYVLVKGIQSAWRGANTVSEQDGQAVRTFAFGDTPKTSTPNYKHWGISDADPRDPTQALVKG